MSVDDKNEQSVMLSLDDLLAQDPSLGKGVPGGSDESGVNHGALDQVGLNHDRNRPAAPMTNVVVPMRHGDVKTKGTSGNFLGVLAALSGVAALIGVGVFIGSMNMPTAPAPAPQLAPAPTPALQPAPAPVPAPQLAPAAVVKEETKEAPNAAPIKAKPKAKVQKKRQTTRRAKAPAAPKAKSKPEPKPKAEFKPEPKPKKVSEAATILSNLKGGKSQTSASPLDSDDAKKDSNLPTKLGRPQILSTLRKNQSSISRCKSHVNEPTKVKMRMVIAGSGKVTKATLISPTELKGKPIEKCMVERVKLFKFPPFSSPSMSIKLPFLL